MVISLTLLVSSFCQKEEEKEEEKKYIQGSEQSRAWKTKRNRNVKTVMRYSKECLSSEIKGAAIDSIWCNTTIEWRPRPYTLLHKRQLMKIDKLEMAMRVQMASDNFNLSK